MTKGHATDHGHQTSERLFKQYIDVMNSTANTHICSVPSPKLLSGNRLLVANEPTAPKSMLRSAHRTNAIQPKLAVRSVFTTVKLCCALTVFCRRKGLSKYVSLNSRQLHLHLLSISLCLHVSYTGAAKCRRAQIICAEGDGDEGRTGERSSGRKLWKRVIFKLRFNFVASCGRVVCACLCLDTHLTPTRDSLTSSIFWCAFDYCFASPAVS